MLPFRKGYGFCPVYQGDGLSYVCRSLQRVTVYSFRLAATNEAGTSPSSPPISYTTLPEPPGAPHLCVSLCVYVIRGVPCV